MSQLKRFSVFFALILAVIVGPASHASAEPQRLALVLGQGGYEGGQLPTAANDAGGQGSAATPGTDCPTVSVAPGDNNITFTAKGGTDSLAVMHRGEITQTARECSTSLSGGLAVKYGFAGRVLLGPQGRPGTVTLPVKVTVLDSGRNTLKSDQVKVPVTITPDQTSGYFSVTREIVIPIAPGANPRAYRIIIAFDRRAPGAS